MFFNLQLWLYLQNIVSIFAGGRSDSRVYLFLIYLSLLFIIFFLIKYRNYYDFEKIIVLKKIINVKNLIFTIAICLIFNLFSYFYFIQTNHLPLKYVITYNHGEMSSTDIFHNHIMKGSIAYTISLFNHNNPTYENLDIGTAYLNLMPNIMFIVGIFLFIILFLVFIFYFIILIKKINKDPNLNKISFILLYSIISFSILKNFLDGGLLNHETIGIIISLSIILFFYNRKIINISAILLSAIFIYDIFINESSWYLYILSVIGIISLIFLIFIIYKKDVRNMLFPFITFFIICSFNLYQKIETSSYRKLKTEEQTLVIAIFQTKKLNGVFIERELIGDMKILESQNHHYKTINDLLIDLKINDNYRPVAIEWITCNPQGSKLSYTFTFKTTRKPDYLKTSKSIYNLIISPTEENFVYNAKLEIDPCIPRLDNFLIESLKDAGLKNFFIYNIKNIYFNQ